MRIKKVYNLTTFHTQSKNSLKVIRENFDLLRYKYSFLTFFSLESHKCDFLSQTIIRVDITITADKAVLFSDLNVTRLKSVHS